MPFTHTIMQRVSVENRNVTRQFEVEAGSMQSLSEPVPDESSDLEILIGIDVSEVVSFYLVCDQDVTVETNDGTTPDDTFNLLAGVPYQWHAQSYDGFLLTADVTSLFVTNDSGQNATLEIEVLSDPTP